MAIRLDELRRRNEPLLRRFFHLYFRIVRGMTLGVRAVVLDSDNKVFLVKHSYVAGWHLPGGGVEVGETFMEALTRELVETNCHQAPLKLRLRPASDLAITARE